MKTLKVPSEPAVKNKKLRCMKKCHKKGPCEKFCGHGLCCKIGDPGKMCDGETGGEKEHVCVSRPVIPKLNILKNAGQQCLQACGGKKGPCPAFCGPGGMCCSKGDPGIGCDGEMGGGIKATSLHKGVVQHTCVGLPNIADPTEEGVGYKQGLHLGSELVAVNGDNINFRKKDPQEVLSEMYANQKNVIHVIGPPSRNPKCSEPQHYCNFQGDTNPFAHPEVTCRY